MRTVKPEPASQKRRQALSAAAAIGLSLAFVGAGIAVLLGIIPPRGHIGAGEFDSGVVLLFVPLCALVFALLVEVVHSTVVGGPNDERPRLTNPLATWRPGNGEG